jgi:GT2 family glycosyltransferase
MLAGRDRCPGKVFLLNPDARLGNEAIEILARFMDETPRAAAAGASLISPEGTPMSGGFRFPTLWSELERTASFGPVSRVFNRFQTWLPPDLPRQRVEWVSGAAVLFRFDAIKDVGFFDPTYFLYFEEVDLMHTLHRKGWETWFVPEAQVVHIEAASTGITQRHGRKRWPPYMYESWRHYFLKNHGRAYALLAAVLTLTGGGIHLAASLLRRREPWLPINYFGDFTTQVLRPLVRGGTGPTADKHP